MTPQLAVEFKSPCAHAGVDEDILKKMGTVDEAERQSIAQQLKRFLEIRSWPADRIQRYEDKIISAQDGGWIRQLGISLREESNIFAGLEEDKPQRESQQAPDVATLLRMEDESHRIATASTRKGRPRLPQDRESLHTRLTALSANREISKDSKHLIAITEPYRPSLKSLDDLNLTELAALTQETHHTDSAILVKRSGRLARDQTAITCVVEDKNGDQEFLELYHTSFRLAEHRLRDDEFFAIKAPYFTVRADGTPAIRVDHPCNVIRPNPRNGTELQPPLERDAAQLKQKGNDFLGQKQLWKAHQAYRDGLSHISATQARLKLDLSRNLARVDLDLECYDEALDAAESAVSDGSDAAMKSLDIKALYRASTASYNLRRYEKSAKCISRLLSLDANDADGKRDNQKVQERLQEENSGSYDFERIASRLSAKNPRADVADFIAAVEVKDSKAGGRGLFATRDLMLGELVLCEKAFCSIFEKDKDWFAAWEYSQGKLSMAASTASLWDIGVEKLMLNPSLISDAMNLRGHYEGIGDEPVRVDDVDVVDVFQFRSIIESNAFGLPTPSKQRATRPFGHTAEHQGATQLGDNTGLFLKVSMMNHSCIPNVRKIFLGDVIIIRATRPISKGEEILQSYAQTDADVNERRPMLESTWHFRCNCKLCSVEEKESDEKLRNRDTLERRANSLGMAIKNSSVSTEEVSKADVLLRSLKSSYDAELYKTLPRKACTYLYVGLIHHYHRQGQRSRCMSAVTSLFDMLGWKLEITTEKTGLSRKENFETHIVPELVEVLLIARPSDQKSSAKKKQVQKLEEIAKDVYIAVNGSTCGWEQLLKSRA